MDIVIVLQFSKELILIVSAAGVVKTTFCSVFNMTYNVLKALNP